METFDFCPNTMVPRTQPRETAEAISLNGWHFTARPTTPFQRKFTVALHGLRWYLDPADDSYDVLTDPEHNANRLEEFYKRHEGWNPFIFNHPHLGPLTVRFGAPVAVPNGEPNGGGFIKSFEIQLVEHNPGY